MADQEKIADELNNRFGSAKPEEVISHFLQAYRGAVVFATSLGAEDQVLTRMISETRLPARIITLDTGRLFEETYRLMDETSRKYSVAIEAFFPEQARVEEMVRRKGINLFYESVENRKMCCHIRKTESLERALSGASVWITGIRREQSVTRYGAAMVEWDRHYQLLKVNPLRDWTSGMVWENIKKFEIPYNPLHDKGFPSIGCAPCTRAVPPGEDQRSGRWWWEQPENKECGIHVPDQDKSSR